MKKKFNGFIMLVLALLVQISFAQEKTVTGTVSDSNGPLPGVTVVVKGTKTGTQTDFDGNYSIKSVTGDVLLFSYIGMLPASKTVGSSTSMDVTMSESAESLDEVVITAIGISRKEKELGYNVQKVEASDIATKPNANVVNSLAGATAGVTVTSSSGDAGSSSYMTIRGAASITGNNQPLFVINGMPIVSDGGYSGVDGVNTSSRSIDINPDDIETISVLKGGAATALYGVRAANGAVVINTKTGKNTGKAEIIFNTSFGVDEVSQLPALQNEFAQGNNGVWSSGNAYSWGPRISDLEYDGDPDYKWDPNGSLVPTGTGNGTAAMAYNPYDFFQTGTVLNNRLSISNGNEKGNYYFSISDLEQEGVIPNNEYGRTTLRLNASTKISNSINFSADLAYTNSRSVQIQKGSNVSGIMLGLLRTPASFDNSAGYEFADGTQRNYRNGSGYDNPYWVANNIKYEEAVNRFTGGINFQVEITDWFNVTYNAGIDWYNRRYFNQFKIGSNAQPSGYYDEYQGYTEVFNSDLLLNFKHTFNDDFGAKLSLGNNMYSKLTKYLYGDATGLEIPDFYQLNNSSNNTTSTGSSQFKTAALFFDLQLNYQSMLFLNITGRNDWSTTMPTVNQSAFYPSASLGFIFTEFEALKGNDILSFGKLRASVARTANIADPYNTSNYYYAAGTGDGWTDGVGFPYQGQTAFQVGSGLGNPDLKHETQNSWEVGADLRFFSNRVGVDFTYFKNENKDLLMSVPVAPSSGFSSVYLNAATMESKGVEITLNLAPIRSENWNWDIAINYSKFSNIVTKLANGVDNIALPGGFTVPQIRAVVGEEYKSIYGYDWYKDESGRVLINDDPTDSLRDGYPMADERSMVPIGNVNPDWTANITNTLSYKNFSLSFLIDIKEGGMMYNGTALALNNFGTSERTSNREVVYNTDGSINFDQTPSENIKVFDGVYGHVDSDGNPVSSDVTNVTPIVEDEEWFQGQGSNFGGGPSSQAMEPADWVRLRDVSLQYTFYDIPGVIQNINFYASGKNLWISTPYTGVDPETSLSGSGNGQGMDYFNSPGTKSYMFGVKLTF